MIQSTEQQTATVAPDAAGVDPYGPEEVAPAEVFTRIKQHFSPRTSVSLRLFGRNAVETSASGCRVELSDGRTPLDFGAYAVGLLGHRPPEVVEAVRRQLDVMTISTRVLGNPVTARAAATLTSFFAGQPGGADLHRVYFGLNGCDAVEAAVKLARLVTGRPRVLAVNGAYHGKSLGALSLTHHPGFRAGLDESLAPTTHVSPADADVVARECRRGDVAALIFEPVQGENGVRPLPADVLAAWCEAARDSGAMVIADEIQTGLRRCGEPSLALAQGLPVDALLLGKALGGGVMPMSAMLCTEALYEPIAENPSVHTATFSGHPLSCATVPATLGLVDRYAERGRVVSAAVERGLTELAGRHGALVSEVRGRGLLWALELRSESLLGPVTTGLARRGLLVSPCVSNPTTLRLLPPIVATDDEVAEALSIVDTVLGATKPAT
ncbi:aspartate aminotransferase family protein [Streptomyces sp. NPDC013455]|uniref:aspartate aminotransferase family protein n=1 Tax=Streptomyces sp. NPDC013455 TaxID=3155605 RepID=UPI0033F90B69